MFGASRTIPIPRIELQTSRHTDQDEVQDLGIPVGEISIKPGEQPHMSLGNFYKTNPAKGFSIRIDPEPQDDAIVTKIVGLESADGGYELVLHIANYGNKIVKAIVWLIE